MNHAHNGNKLFPTSEKFTVDSYPYGRLRCSATFGVEFKPGKGFRTTFQTINPKTGRVNAVKHSTYSPIIVMYEEQATKHAKFVHFDFYGDEGINKAAAFLYVYFDLFTPEQIKDICSNLFVHIKASVKSRVIYTGADFERLKPIFQPAIDAVVEGFKTGANIFDRVKIDAAAADECKQPDFQPFKVTHYSKGLSCQPIQAV